MNFLKIQTPSNQIFKIDLGTTETDFIKLLACLSNIEQENIKGLKDKFGNYFTIFSALYNPQGNFNYSNVYFLVCSDDNNNNNKNLNYPILDKFENFPNYQIPNSFSHDSNNYFKRKNIHNISNRPSDENLKSLYSVSNVKKNVYPQVFTKDNESSLSPFMNKNISRIFYNNNNDLLNNNMKQEIGNLENIDVNQRGEIINFPTDNSRIKNINLNSQYQMNHSRNYRNINDMSEKQNTNSSIYYRQNHSNNSIKNDNIEENQSDFFSVDNRNRMNDKMISRNLNYNQNNLGTRATFTANNRNNTQKYPEDDYDYLKKNLVRETYVERKNHMTSQKIDKFNKNLYRELNSMSNDLNQLYRDKNVGSGYSGEGLIPNNIFSNSVNLKILQQKKINENNKLKNCSSTNFSKDIKQLQIEKYLSIANDFNDLNIIDNRYLPKLKQLILNENEDITTIFKLFCQDIIEIETLVNGIDKILNFTLNKNIRPDSPDSLLNKNQLVKLIDSLNDSIFDDPSDYILLRNLANYQNDFILAAYEIYLSDHDIENFIDSVKRFINKYNKPNNNANQAKKDENLRIFQERPFYNQFEDFNQINRKTKNTNLSLKEEPKFLEFKEKDIFSRDPMRDENDLFNKNRKNSKLECEENNEANENTRNNKIFYPSEEDIDILRTNIIQNEHKGIQTSSHNSKQLKTVSNLNLNANISEENKHNNINNNQYNSNIKPQEKILISTFTTSNYTLHDKNSNNFKENNNINNNIEKDDKRNKEENIQYFNNNQNINLESNNKISENITYFENLLKFLHTEQRIIFKYAIKNKFPEINVFAQLHSTIDSEEILLRAVKQFCKQFIGDKVIKNLNEDQNKAFKNLMQKRDQILLGFFKEFNKHNSIEKLQSDILKYLYDNLPKTKNQIDLKQKNASNIVNINNGIYNESNTKMKETDERDIYKDEKIQNKHRYKNNFNADKNVIKNDKYKNEKSYSSSDIEDNLEIYEREKNYRREEAHNNDKKYIKEESDNENMDDHNNIDNANEYYSSEEIKNNYNLVNFLKLINNFNFINSQQKKLLEKLIDENNEEIIEIFDSYIRTKNIMTVKSSIKSLMRKYKKNSEIKISLNNDIKIRNVSSKNSIEYNQNKGGEILLKLEKIKKQNTKSDIKTKKFNNYLCNDEMHKNENFVESEEDSYSPNKKKRIQNNEKNCLKTNMGNFSKKDIKLFNKNKNKNQSSYKNDNYIEQSDNFNLKEDHQNSEDSYNTAKNSVKIEEKHQLQKIFNLENKSYESLDELLQDLEENQKISSHQHKYIIQRYRNRDEILLSAWEVYSYNKYLPDLIESLRIFSTNVRRQSNVATMSKTPVALAKSKNDIIDFLKSKDNNKEKEEIKKKQLNIIEILVNENMLDRKTAPIINQMIFQENHLLISAFEIFSVSKDHWEFVETLGMITDIHCNDFKKISKSSTSLEKIAAIENKDSRLAILFENFMKGNKCFKDNEIDMFRKKLFTKDDFFMSSLEFYENNLDQEEFIENLQQVLK